MSSAQPWASGAFTIACDHPALAGHFPGNPIVPGVALLRHVVRLLAAHIAADASVTVVDAKFLRPLRPDQVCEIVIDPGFGGKHRFECRVQQDLVARGSLLVEGWD